MADENKQSNGVMCSNLPKQAHFIMDLLNECGVDDYDPQVVNQLLEYSYSFITTRLSEASELANHAGRTNIALDDVKLSIQRKAEECSTTVLSRENLMELAREKNAQPLPPLKTYLGPRLPPDRFCLSSINYRLKNESITPQGDENKTPSMASFVDPASLPSHMAGDARKGFVNPQMIMPGSKAIKRKYQEDDDYD